MGIKYKKREKKHENNSHFNKSNSACPNDAGLVCDIQSRRQLQPNKSSIGSAGSGDLYRSKPGQSMRYSSKLQWHVDLGERQSQLGFKTLQPRWIGRVLYARC